MPDKFLEAHQILNDAAAKSPGGCIVFYSGGKDSLVVMDLAIQHFKRVVPVFMYFVPGLSVCEKQLSYCKERWGLDVLQVPHWVLFRAKKYGVYCLPKAKNDEIRDIKLLDIYNYVLKNTGLQWIATGAKMADSVWRKQQMKTTAEYQFLLSPIQNWNKFDVLYYLKKNNIPVPDAENAKKAASGIDLATPTILWLYDKHRDDFDRMASVFPFVGAVVKRRELYGIER